ncbi:hypothetical protein GCM10009802_16060 [Streptomyces synnematoformans]|uniref:GatB/YqeY domain-containing protein n=2 Tax=Streptomyces synnematoformans TaxID=415721 RepID=A0ABP5JC36_9ACTN
MHALRQYGDGDTADPEGAGLDHRRVGDAAGREGGQTEGHSVSRAHPSIVAERRGAGVFRGRLPRCRPAVGAAWETPTMTTLKSKLQDDLTAAIKGRDELRAATLRMTLTAITKEEVAGAEARELSDDEVQKVITREAKKRREAADAFEQAGRAESAERERAEGEVLAAYLPQQLGDEELAALVAEAVAEAKAGGAEGPRAMGAVMKIVNPRVAGRAEGGRVAAAVKRALAEG